MKKEKKRKEKSQINVVKWAAGNWGLMEYGIDNNWKLEN